MFNNNGKNEKGMALVSAIIIIALLAIMSGSLLQMSYLAYTRKVTERRSNETFYTAESCIDTIKAAVQNKVAAAVEKSNEGTAAFLDAAKLAVTTNLGTDLRTYLYNQIVYENGDTSGTLKNDSLFYHGYKNGDYTTIKDGIDPANGGEFSVGDVEADISSNTLRIKDVHVKFVNKQGYVAEITTDIVVNAPIYFSGDEIPVGTYSMFAGSGVVVTQNAGYKSNESACENAIYMHQEGNVYFGYGTVNRYGKDISASLYLDPNGNGGIFFSIGGSRAKFNGDIYLTNGSTLIFTGNDGIDNEENDLVNKPKNASVDRGVIQVQGNIYMHKGASILLAPNMKLECQGIYEIDDLEKFIGDNDQSQVRAYDGNTYGGKTLDTSLSQFYPLADKKIVTDEMGTTYSTKYLSNEADVAECLYEFGDGALKMPTGNQADYYKYYDARAYNVGDASTTTNRACGVYVLSTKQDKTNGWQRKAGDKYYLIKKSSNTWAVAEAGVTGVYNDNLYVNENDINLATVDPVQYGVDDEGYTVEVDHEFAQIFNMPSIDIWDRDSNSMSGKYYLSDYNTSDSSTYDFVYWGGEENEETGIIENGLYDKLTEDGLISIRNMVYWDDVKNEFDDTDQLIGLRKFRIPKKTETEQHQNDGYLDVNIIEGGKTIKYVPGQIGVGITQGGNTVVNCGENANSYYIQFSAREIEVHIAGQYIGLILSAKNARIGDAVGITRGISLLDAAKKTAHSGLKNEDNEVRKMLERLSGRIIPQDFGVSSPISGLSTKKCALGIGSFDNLFNGGIESFWTSRASNADSSSASASNSGKDFVEVDNWNKH